MLQKGYVAMSSVEVEGLRYRFMPNSPRTEAPSVVCVVVTTMERRTCTGKSGKLSVSIIITAWPG